MKFQGAVIKEQNVTFAIVIVKSAVTQNPVEADKVRAGCQSLFPGTPIVLASQDHQGTFQYQGRTDLAKFLASIDASRIPWREYTTR